LKLHQNELAGPVKQSCLAVHDIIRKISISYLSK